MKYSKEDYVSRIASASPLKLVIINYELLIGSVEEAIASEADEAAFVRNLSRARDFLSELVSSLDMSVEISKQLAPVYFYVNKIFTDSLRTKKAERLPETVKIMSKLLKAWNAITGDENGSAPLIANAQKIYSNITYGKNGTLDTYESEANRGFTV